VRRDVGAARTETHKIRCDTHGRWQQRQLSQAEAFEILGISEWTFRRWRKRYGADGREGLLDQRLGKASARGVLLDQVNHMLTP